MAGDNGGWAEYRLLLLEMLERHEREIGNLNNELRSAKDHCRMERESLKDELMAHVTTRFRSLYDMSTELYEMNKNELIREIQDQREIETIQISKRWEFWIVLVTSVTSIIVALIALLS